MRMWWCSRIAVTSHLRTIRPRSVRKCFALCANTIALTSDPTVDQAASNGSARVRTKRPSIYALEPELRVLEMQVLLIVGEHDHACVPVDAYIRRMIPNAVDHVLPGAGDLKNLEAPKRSIAHLTSSSKPRREVRVNFAAGAVFTGRTWEAAVAATAKPVAMRTPCGLGEPWSLQKAGNPATHSACIIAVRVAKFRQQQCLLRASAHVTRGCDSHNTAEHPRSWDP
jgi:hypothetical protein